MELREYFKLMIKESKDPDRQACTTTLGKIGHKAQSFDKQTLRRRYEGLSDAEIDKMSDEEMEERMTMFIVAHFRMR